MYSRDYSCEFVFDGRLPLLTVLHASRHERHRSLSLRQESS